MLKKMQKETAAQMLLIHIGQALATFASWPLAAARHFRWQCCLMVSNQIRRVSNEKQERTRQALIFVSEPAYINLKIVCIDKHSDPDVLSITHQRRRLILVRETNV